MIYAHGTSLWHGVRVVGETWITTLCGLRIDGQWLAAKYRTPFLCRSCEGIMERSS